MEEIDDLKRKYHAISFLRSHVCIHDLQLPSSSKKKLCYHYVPDIKTNQNLQLSMIANTKVNKWKQKKARLMAFGMLVENLHLLKVAS